jgi:hypothetical protein
VEPVNRVPHAVVLMFLAVAPAIAQNVEVRHHYDATSRRIGASYRVTEIFSMPNETEDRRIFLLEDNEAGDRVLLTETRDYLRQTDSYEILDLQTKERIAAIVQWPYKSATRNETIEEMRAAPAVDPPITLESGGVSVSARESEWETPNGRERRSSLRRAATSQFLERLERMRPIIGASGMLTSFCAALLKFVLYHEACNGPIRFEPAPPDCDFDAAFRYKCSDAQKARVRQAAESKTLLRSY